MSWIDECIDEYYKWMKRNTSIREDLSSGWNAITTPFYGLFNDPIEIYVKFDGERIFLSDDGITLQNLELSGVSITRSPKRKEWLEYILLNYGIKMENGELVTIANFQNFPQQKHNLICAISEVSDMNIVSKHTISSLFREDVKGLLDEQGIIYTPQFITKGSTGIDFTFDFQIAGKEKELVLKSFNTLSKINVPNFLFSFDDIKDSRERVSGKRLQSLAIVNDEDRDIKTEYLTAFENKNVDYILWSERNKPENIQKLTAA